MRRSAWLDNGLAPFAQSDGIVVFGDLFQESQRLQILNNLFPRLEAVHTGVNARRRVHLAVVGHHVYFRQFVASPHLEVVRIVRRRDFHSAGPELAVHHRVRDYRNLAIHQWQQRFFANELRVPLVFRIHRHSRVAQHRLRTGCRHHDEFLRSRHRIFDVPQVSQPLLMEHFQVAQHRQAHRTPVQQPVLPVN